MNSDAPSPLVFGRSTQKRIKLKEQPEVIQDILHRGIAKASEDVFLKKTWPEESARRHIYGTGILLGVCGDGELVELFGKDLVSDVKRRLKRDAKFAKAMSDVVCNLHIFHIFHNSESE